MSNTSNQDQPKGKWAKKPFALTLVLAVVVLVASAALVYALINRSDGKDAKLSPVQSAQKAASRASATGDHATALQKLKAVESQAKTKEEKLRLYSDIAAAAASSSNMSEALAYMEKKHQLDPSTKGADGMVLGSYYESIDNKAKAIEYYKLAVEYAEAQSQKDTVTIESLKARIAQLEGREQ